MMVFKAAYLPSSLHQTPSHEPVFAALWLFPSLTLSVILFEQEAKMAT